MRQDSPDSIKPVILSEAKNLHVAYQRFFASLRMTDTAVKECLMEQDRTPQVLDDSLTPDNLAERLATLTTGYTPDPERELEEPSYYDYPVLKAPTWRWEIIWYFFFGGLAAGCYVIASIASLFGSQEDRAVARTGYYLSLLSVLPAVSSPAHQRPGQARAFFAHAAHLQGEVAHVDGHVGPGQLLAL